MAERLTRTPRELTAGDWQALRDVGLDDQGLLELGHLVAIFNYFAHLADGFGLVLHPLMREAAATGVPLRRPA